MAAKPLERRDIEDALDKIRIHLRGLSLAIYGLAHAIGDNEPGDAMSAILDGAMGELESLGKRIAREQEEEEQ
ncbi:hypothetical protein WOC76_04440 [Methylocystis sp. IM3]|jgi:hypothetical protein|uniref:hypothetical protein n=1 Tax=unclassified Methylocystis TaxID=2625913 RepID=UPI0030F6EEA3